MDKEALLAQVRKMNARLAEERAEAQRQLEDRLDNANENLQATSATLSRLRGEVENPEFLAAKAQKAELQAEIGRIQRAMDPASEFEAADEAITRAREAGETKDEEARARFVKVAARLDGRLHRHVGSAKHPQPFDNNARTLSVHIDRPIMALGPAVREAEKLAWTRFDSKPAVPWHVPKQHEGLSQVYAEERRIQGEIDAAAEAAAAELQIKPALDLSFGLTAGNNRTGGTLVLGHNAGAETSPRGRTLAGSASLGRSSLPPLPSSTVPPRQLTSTAVPARLLDTLTRGQLAKPRHPAYLLDSTVHHEARWRKTDKQSKPFSSVPALKPATESEKYAAKHALEPARVRYAPKNDGKKPFLENTAGAYPLFAPVPLDRDWIKVEDARIAAQLEKNFWAAARDNFEGDDAFGGGESEGEGKPPAGSSTTVALQGELSLGFAAAQRYTERKATLSAERQMPLLGVRALAAARAAEDARLGALSASIATARGGTGNSMWRPGGTPL
jgi:hypothetical protein